MKSRNRRIVLQVGGSLLLSAMNPLKATAAQILAVRVWPSDDYTRVTLEHDHELKATHFLVKDPNRLVIDVEGLELDATLKQLVAKIKGDDPFIKQVRVGQNRPNVVRLVFDLKTDINPQVFTLAPVGSYQSRLIFDLYPANGVDAIEKLMAGERPSGAGNGTNASSATPTGSAPNAATANPGTTSNGSNRPDRTTAKPEDGSNSGVNDLAHNDEDGDKPGTGRARRMITIALDPGHGGEDPGAIGHGGSREKDVVLAIAKRIKAKIEQHPNMRVMLTRDADFFVPLQTRVQKARKVQADLFVSVHADAFVEPSARGSSVFVLSEKGASSAAARWLANNENAADLIGGVNLKTHDQQLASVLLDLSTTAQINDSMKLAKAVIGEIGGINRLHRGAVEQAGFAVLKAPDIPSILVETAFISNPEEEARLGDEDYQDQMADAILKGIRKYLSKNPPLSRSKFT